MAGTLEDNAYWAESTNRGAEPNVVNNAGGKIVINGGTFETTQSFQYPVCTLDNGTTEINGGTFVGYRGCVDATSGSVTINGGTFTGGNAMGGHVVYANNGHVVINGGTFTGTYALENGGTGSITFKAGVTLTGVVLTEDLVIGTPVTE